MQYLAWRVLTGLHRKVTMSFMLVGHTKFAPDWCFGLFKQRYRRTFVSSLKDVAEVVNASADVNVAQLVGTQSGEPVVTKYDWATFLGQHFKNVPHLKTFHHFSFSSEMPGVVTMKQFSDSVGVSFTMLDDEEWCAGADELPPVIKPVGFSPTRQWYLYRQIREFCRDGTEDLTCPKPFMPIANSPNQSEEEEECDERDVPQPKRVCRCGKCGGAGHTRRTCKDTS